MMLSFLFVAVVISKVLRVGSGDLADYTKLPDAVAAAEVGDIVELLDFNYDLSETLVLSRPISIITRDFSTRAVLRSTSFDVDVLVAVGANDISLRNLVFGRSANDRAIDIFVSAGTQTKQSSLFGNEEDYNGDNETPAQRSVSSLLGAAGDQPTESSNRAIRGFTLQNVDFSASISATNVAFDTGAYIDVSINHCVFGTRDFTEAIVAVGGARFADSVPLQFNAFDKAALALNGVGLEVGTNFWSGARPALSSTYCIDRGCTLLGPVVDNDHPSARAFTTVADALNAGVQNVLITAAEVELGVLNGPIAQAQTTIRGRRIISPENAATDNCEPDAAVTMVHVRGSDSPLVSLGVALSYVVDVRFEIHNEVLNALRYIDGPLSGDALLERVSFLGADDHQTALVLNSRSVSLTLINVVVLNTGIGVELLAGALVVTDSQFLINRYKSISVGGTGVGTGLRVSGSLFAAAPEGAIVFESTVKSALMLPISVTCTQFINALFAEPSDCSSNAQQCANALRHNTFLEVVDPQRVAPNHRFLMHGGNHIERVSERALADYVKFEDNQEQGHSFSFADKQGRFGRVRADISLLNHAASQFVFAAHVPMRQECFAESVPGQRVVSGMFSLATDAPRRCISLALQFTVVADPKDNSTASASDDVSIYDVAHLGNSIRGSAVWQRAASHSVVNGGGAITVEASSGAGALLRAVVVAQKLTDTERAALLAAGTAEGVVSARHHYCVACGSDALPAYIVDERCGGGSDSTRIGNDFDTMFDAALATGLGDSVALLVYGTQCATSRCTLRVTSMEFTLEGFSVSQQGVLTRPSRCAADEPMISLAAPRATLRYLTLTTEKPVVSTSVPQCAVDITQDHARVSFCSINGGVCVRESAAQITGNDIAGPSGWQSVLVARSARDTLVQANSLGAGVVSVARGALATRIDRNTFAAQSGVEVAGTLLMTGNTFLARSHEAMACLTTSVLATDVSVTSTGDMFGANCRLPITAASKVRISGTRGAAPWQDVVLELSGAADARVANVDLLGANTQIVLQPDTIVDAKKQSQVVLYDVGVDLTTSSISDTLIGGPLTHSPECSASYEPRLAGFALAQSVIVDAASRRVLLVGASGKLKSGDYIDTMTGDVRKCAATPNAEFCVCALAKQPTATTTAGTTKTEEQPVELAVHVAVDPEESVEDTEEEIEEEEPEPIVEEKPAETFIEATVAAVIKQVGGGRFNGGRGGGSVTWLWITLGIIAFIVIVIVAVVICCCVSSNARAKTIIVEQGGEESSTESSSTAPVVVQTQRRKKQLKRIPPKSSFGVNLSTTTSTASAATLTLRHITKRGEGEVEDY
jgi:hypothetical protein